MRRSRYILEFCCLIAACTSVVLAQASQQTQTPRPVQSPSAELLRLWMGTHNKLIAMAKDFPEDKFDFRVQKDQRTFAENLLHVAGTDYEFLRAISGQPMGPDLKDIENPPRATYKTKADVVKFLQSATDEGAALIKQLGDSGIAQEKRSPFAPAMQHVSFMFYDDLEHAGEHYGQLVVYYRANNLIPPESRPQPGQ